MLLGFLRSVLDVICFTLRLGSGSSFPRPLTAAEERDCLERMAKGDTSARDALIERNLRLVAHIIKKYYASTSDQDDLISIGTIGLIKAVSTFKPEKGTRLATYAARCIENEILMYFRSIKRQSLEVSLSDPIDSDPEGNSIDLMDVISTEDHILDRVDTYDQYTKMMRLIASELTELEREIILAHYGIQRPVPLTQREIAERYKISRSYVSRIEKRAIQKLGELMGSNNPNRV